LPFLPNNPNLTKNKSNIHLTILITIVSGKDALRRCLEVLYPQVDFREVEIIVPFDKWSKEIGEIVSEFPEVKFHFIENLGLATSDKITAHEHRLYDRRRAVGLNLSQGRIIAMTENHAVPAEDWIKQIMDLHKQPFDVIGGAIENNINKPINWALYYCDFGRYGKPLKEVDSNYVSDINVAYKREAIMSVREIWSEAYHETSVHWALRSNGIKLVLDERMTVYQERPQIKLTETLRERINWGRVFAETRAIKMNFPKRLIYAVGTILLPPLLLMRVFKNMFRQKRNLSQMATTLPLAFLLLIGWSVGEMLGYLKGEPQVNASKKIISPQNSYISGQQDIKSKLVI
jgi:hypothetical protein